MTAQTNTGISTTPDQCVFHVTINAGQNGIPAVVTDIAVRNGGSAALTGINTITASATVRLRDGFWPGSLGSSENTDKSRTKAKSAKNRGL